MSLKIFQFRHEVVFIKHSRFLPVIVGLEVDVLVLQVLNLHLQFLGLLLLRLLLLLLHDVEFGSVEQHLQLLVLDLVLAVGDVFRDLGLLFFN